VVGPTGNMESSQTAVEFTGYGKFRRALDLRRPKPVVEVNEAAERNAE
jgi:hypothetical protein